MRSRCEQTVLSTNLALAESLEPRQLYSGEIDHTFADGGLMNVRDVNGSDVIHVMSAVQADGRILVAVASAANGNTAVVRRYLANGKPDATFGVNGIATVPNVRAYTLDKLTVLADGRIQVLGVQSIRLTAAGQLDSTFGGGDGIAPSILAANRRAADFSYPDGSYLEMSNGGANWSGRRVTLFRHRADGSIDNTFAGGKGYFDLTARYSDVLTQGNLSADAAGRIYLSFMNGDSSLPNSHFLRLTGAGRVDGTWGTNGLSSTGANWLQLFSGISILNDGRVILLGYEPSEGGVGLNDLIFFSKTGDLQGISPIGPATTFFPQQIVQAKTGRLFVGGYYYDGVDPYSTYGLSYSAVLSVNSDFSTNDSFSPDHDGIGGFRLAGGNTSYGGMAVQPDGDLLLLGDDKLVRLEGPAKFNKVSASFSNTVVTLHGSGQIDHFLATTMEEFDFSFPNSTVAYFDNNGVYVSADHVVIPIDSFTVSLVVMNLNGGNDRVDASTLAIPTVIRGGNGNDLIYGTSLKDSLYGDAGVDTIFGNGGGDVIVP